MWSINQQEIKSPYRHKNRHTEKLFYSYLYSIFFVGFILHSRLEKTHHLYIMYYLLYNMPIVHNSWLTQCFISGIALDARTLLVTVTTHFSAGLKAHLSLWCLTGPSGMTGPASLRPQTVIQLRLVSVRTAYVSTPYRGVGTSAIAPRDTRVIPMSLAPTDAQVSFFVFKRMLMLIFNYSKKSHKFFHVSWTGRWRPVYGDYTHSLQGHVYMIEREIVMESLVF